MKASKALDPVFLLWSLRDPTVLPWLGREMNDNTGVPTLRIGTTGSLPISPQPIAEQKRIVAKVEHLIKLCDALEAALRRREDRAAKLAEAVVQEMVA